MIKKEPQKAILLYYLLEIKTVKNNLMINLACKNKIKYNKRKYLKVI